MEIIFFHIIKIFSLFLVMHSDASKVTSNPGRCHYGWHQAGKLSKSVTLDALKNTLPGPACF